MDIINKKALKWDILCSSMATVILLLSIVLNPINRFFWGFFVMLSAVVFYFLICFLVAQKNFMDIKALFTGVWLFTIGMGSLRLTDFQEQWQKRTWLVLALAYLFFQIGATVGKSIGPKILNRIKNIKLPTKKIVFKLREERLFWICAIATGISIVCFIANILIKGFVPFFSSEPDAYLNFYTKFYLISVAVSSISGLCYYCIKTQPLSVIKKIILFGCILFNTFVFPILVVSRGNFIVSALFLTTAIFYLNKKRFLVLLCCLLVMLGVYEFGTSFRNLSNQQLDYIFEPSEIVVDPDSENNEGKVFALSPRAAFLYSYLTSSHDNFNEAVQNSEKLTYGTRQMAPFNVILRIPLIEKVNANAERYQVRPHLNTTSLICDAYYDFREIGVVISVFIWALIFGIIQSIYIKKLKPFALLALGNVMTPVILCFFATWMSIFSFWMMWGLNIILGFIACVNKNNDKGD